MNNNINVTCLTGFLGRIHSFFKDLLKHLVNDGASRDGTTNSNVPVSGVGNTVINSGNITITNNITANFNIDCSDLKAVAQQFSQGTENMIVAKDDVSGFSVFIHWNPKAPEFLAAGFFATCSFGDKKDLPIRAGFQPQKPSKDNTLEDLTFSIELLGREVWGGKSSEKRAVFEELGYKGKGKDDEREAVYCKFYNGMTLKTDPQELYGWFCKELEDLGKRLL
ncbi:MAG: hypothetical protein LBK61_02515 [Spirochaetaceae bacterium]|jgi:hypothetical protein|nr:hypothetical protein [Spirochaetaceae bacterium]